jgi:hypothetical protein
LELFGDLTIQPPFPPVKLGEAGIAGVSHGVVAGN